MRKPIADHGKDSPVPESHSAGERLRRLMDSRCVVAPGAFNALCGAAAAQAGFGACYVSGAASSVSAGLPDIGLLTLDQFVRLLSEVASASGLPVLADADTGFGEGEMVRRTVIEYHRAGAAGLHLEDQVFPKRCGHLDGKTLVPVEHACEKIEAATRAAVDCSDGTFIVCARTDARGVTGFEDAVARARAYVEAGADMIFPEGLASEGEFQAFAAAMSSLGDRRPYLLANMTEFGKTPAIPASRFEAMGYNIVLFPVTMLRVAMGAVTRALATLRQTGSAQALLDQMQTRAELYDLIGYTPGTAWEFPARS